MKAINAFLSELKMYKKLWFNHDHISSKYNYGCSSKSHFARNLLANRGQGLF